MQSILYNLPSPSSSYILCHGDAYMLILMYMRIRVSQGIGSGAWYEPSTEDVLHVMITWSTVSQIGPVAIIQ